MTVSFRIASGHHLYAERVSVEPEGGLRLKPAAIPAAKRIRDVFSDEEVGVYDRDVVLTYDVEGSVPPGAAVRVGFQGCSESMCFMPESVVLPLAAGVQAGATSAAGAGAGAVPEPGGDWRSLIGRFEVEGTAAGYLGPEKFVSFLDQTQSGDLHSDRIRDAARRGGVLAVMLLVLLGGLALNLTPCVLPMIPVNLAIIGAGAASGSRTRGFALGAAYGAGMALAYGALGVAAVLTGARFGTLNSSPWFNLGIAGLFAVLGIAMFDVVRIDLTRFQPGGAPRRGQGMAAALLLGAVAALLAGACVAPVLLSVLLFAADLNAKGSTGALLLPFLLGVGMALPWPIAGAGISWLPKPGRWMQRVKYVFGAAILAAALWYGRLGVSLALERRAGSRHEVEQSLAAGAGKDCETSLAAGLNRALAEDRRVFVDMWASWCKNCLKMERTTFRDPGVQSRLASYVRVKFRAEDVREPAVKAVLDHFKAVGLPTYVVLRPRAG